MATDVLVIPDSHAHPDWSNRRFEWLGKMIYDLRPTYVVDIGDSADMPSLCSYDKGTKGYEQRTFIKDCNAYKDAMDKLWHQFKKNKKRMPVRIKTRGNHEHRIQRAIDYETTFTGCYGFKDLGEEDYNDIVLPFLQEYKIEGVRFNHYAPSPLLQRPIGGVNPAHQVLKKMHTSYVFGHDHRRSFFEENNLAAICVGCYIEEKPDWIGPAWDNWWKGIVYIKIDGSVINPSFIRLEEIKNVYN